MIDLFKLSREMLAMPFIVLGILFGFLAKFIYGEGYADFVIGVAKYFHDKFNH